MAFDGATWYMDHRGEPSKEMSGLADYIVKHWFVSGLLLIPALTLVDTTGTVPGAGTWLVSHGGPDAIILLVFFFSGLGLDSREVSAGIRDLQGITLALLLVFAVSPLLSILPCALPLEEGIRIGIFLVAAMPTTLSTGVVMTGAARGNVAHALTITILANGLSVFTIPITLSFLLHLMGQSVPVSIDKSSIMVQIALLVIAPLVAGGLVRRASDATTAPYYDRLQVVNQILVLVIVWTSVSQSRLDILANLDGLALVSLLAFFYHGLVLIFAWALIRLFRLPPGRRESIIFMGGQKTLILSVILQASYFSQYGTALVFCVVHHIIHLLMDGFLVEKLRASRCPVPDRP